MKLISCHDGKLLTLSGDAMTSSFTEGDGSRSRAFRTGLPVLDALCPGGAFARGAVHELLFDINDGQPAFVAMLLAGASAMEWWSGGVREYREETVFHSTTPPPRHSTTLSTGAIVWCDPTSELYPPALAAHGIPLERLYLLRPPDPADELWAVAECLRCKGVGAVVAAPPPQQRLTRLEARRLQLAAERGGGIGVLMRPAGKISAEHAAATRWLVRPAPGERTVQRWRIQLVHGHGGRVGQHVFLEHHRETNSVRAVERLADHGGRETAGAGRASA